MSMFLLLTLVGGLLPSVCLADQSSSPTATSAPLRITLDVREADIHHVFRLLARAGGVNLVVSDAVSGRVTLHLEDVPWPLALDAVVRARGLGLERVGDILFVDTLAHVQQRAEEKRQADEAAGVLAPLHTVLYPLSYADALTLVLVMTPLLSSRGKLSVDKRTNTLIVVDTAEIHRLFRALLWGT